MDLLGINISEHFKVNLFSVYSVSVSKESKFITHYIDLFSPSDAVAPNDPPLYA